MKSLWIFLILFVCLPYNAHALTRLSLHATFCDTFGISVPKGSQRQADGCYSKTNVPNVEFKILRVPSGDPKYMFNNSNRRATKIIQTNSRGRFKVKLHPGFYVIQVTNEDQLNARVAGFSMPGCDTAAKLGSDIGGARIYLIRGAHRFASLELFSRCPV